MMMEEEETKSSSKNRLGQVRRLKISRENVASCLSTLFIKSYSALQKKLAILAISLIKWLFSGW